MSVDLPLASDATVDDGRRAGEISLAEAATMLGVSPKRLRKLCNDKVVPSVSRFTLVFIPLAQLHEWYALPENRAMIRPFQVYPCTIDVCGCEESSTPPLTLAELRQCLLERFDALEALIRGSSPAQEV